jgi:hypothetical protein
MSLLKFTAAMAMRSSSRRASPSAREKRTTTEYNARVFEKIELVRPEPDLTQELYV